ncbi:MAG: hypothetical protein V4537_12435 [Pseudomonadota bacterium]
MAAEIQPPTRAAPISERPLPPPTPESSSSPIVIDAVRGVSNAWASWASAAGGFVFIFLLYAIPSSVLMQDFSAGFGVLPGSPPDYVVDLTDMRLSLYWAAVAIVAIMLAIFVTGWSIGALRRYLPDRWLTVTGFLVCACAASYLIADRAAVSLISTPRLLTCVASPQIESERTFLCSHPILEEDGIIRREPRALAPGVEDSRGTRWITAVLRLKVVLNLMFQIAAIFVIGAMLALAVPCRIAPEAADYRRRLTQERPISYLFVAGGALLSAVTLTDIVLANWPIAVMSTDKAKIELAEIMTAVIFFYAVLGSLTLAGGLLLARWIAGGPLQLLTDDASNETELDRGLRRVRTVLFHGTTLKVLVALSPIITTAVSTPIVKALLAGMNASVTSG